MKEQLNEQIRLNQLEANLRAAEKTINQKLQALSCDGVGKTIKSVYPNYSDVLLVYTDGSYTKYAVSEGDYTERHYLRIRDTDSRFVVPVEYEAFREQSDAYRAEENKYETERRYGKVMRQIKDRYGIDVSPEDLR